MGTLKVYDDTEGAGVCRSCQAAITWFELTSGKKHPFDGREPEYVGRETEPETGRLIGEIDASGSHFVTCPQSQSWKRRG